MSEGYTLPDWATGPTGEPAKRNGAGRIATALERIAAALESDSQLRHAEHEAARFKRWAKRQRKAKASGE